MHAATPKETNNVLKVEDIGCRSSNRCQIVCGNSLNLGLKPPGKLPNGASKQIQIAQTVRACNRLLPARVGRELFNRGVCLIVPVLA